jgi:hypothetical protein
VLLVSLVLPLACDDDPEPFEDDEVRLLGALVTPRISYEIDPLLSDAYQSISGDDYQVAHTAVSWAEVVPEFTVRNWEGVDIHIEQARRRGIQLSLAVEFLRGGDVDLPRYVEDAGWAWDEPSLVWELSRFLRELKARSRDTIGYLWLGEGPDRYVERYPEREDSLLSFYGVLADSARRIFPNARLGVLIAVPALDRTGRVDLIRALRDTLGSVALSVYPEELAGEGQTPEEALGELQSAIEVWRDGPFAIVESGYASGPDGGSVGDDQSAFAIILGDWLRGWPSSLEFFCWSPIHDAAADLADSLAARRYPEDAVSREQYASILSSTSLRRLDGTRKPAREIFMEYRP